MQGRLLQSERLAEPAEPLWTLDDLKAHLRVDHDAEDNLISAYAKAAQRSIEGVERAWRIALLDQTWRDFRADWTIGPLRLAPVRSIVQVVYLDPDGAEKVLDPDQWSLVQTALGGEVVLEGIPPALRDIPSPVRIDYVAGHGADAAAASEVLEDLLHAIRLLVGHFYRNREAVTTERATELPLAVQHLLQPYRRY